MNPRTLHTTADPAPPVRRRCPNPAPLFITVLKRRTDYLAHLTWSRHWSGASLSLSKGLTERQELEAVRWAADTVLSRRLDRGELDGSYRLHSADLPAQGPAVALDDLDRWGRGVGTLLCADCGSEFWPDSSPSFTLCWSCDERADAEAGL